MLNALRLPVEWSRIKQLIWLRGNPATGGGYYNWLEESGDTPLFLKNAYPHKMQKCETNILPVQDLHGYDSPWPAGGGKNLLDLDKASYNALAYGFTVSREGNGVRIAGTSTATGNLSFNLITNYADDSLSGKGYILQVFNVTSGYEVGAVWGFRTETERAFAISLTGITEGQVVNCFMNLSVAVTSQTSWTPYSNICPISGWQSTNVYIEPTYDPTATPKASVTFGVQSANQWDEEWEEGSIDNNTGMDTPSNASIRAKNYIPIKPDTNYYFVCPNASSNGIRIYWYEDDYTFISSSTARNTSVTSPTNAHYLRIRTTGTYGNTYQHDIAVNYPNTTTTYNPYSDNIFGGTLDIATGDGMIDRVMWLGRDLSWNKVTGNNYRSFVTTPPVGIVYSNTVATITSSMYKATANNYASAADDNYVWPNANQPLNRIAVKDTSKAALTADEYKAYVADVQFVCQLQTPIPFHIDGLSIKPLKGDNNVWTDCGNHMSVMYATSYPLETLTATGSSPLLLANSQDKKLVQCEVEIEATQEGSGDPSPDNVRPIHGVSTLSTTIADNSAGTGGTTYSTVFDVLGSNQWDEQSETGYYDITDGSAKTSSSWKRSKNAISCTPQTSYCFIYKGSSQDSMGYLLFYGEDGEYLNSYTQLVLAQAITGQSFTTPANARYVKFYSKPSHFEGNIAINSPSTVTTYQPYTNECYGGTFNELTGELTMSYGIVDFGTLGWVYNSSFEFFSADIGTMKPNTLNSLCTAYKNSKASSISNVSNEQYYVYSNAIRIKDNRYTDDVSFKSAVSGVKFVYELATPITKNYDPHTIKSLAGHTYVLSNGGGDVTVQYKGITPEN